MSRSGYGDADKLAAARELQASYHRGSGGKRHSGYPSGEYNISGQNMFQNGLPRTIPVMNPGDGRQVSGYKGQFYQPKAPRGPRPPLDIRRLNQPSTLPASLIQGAQDFLQVRTPSNASHFGSSEFQKQPNNGEFQGTPVVPKQEVQRGDSVTNTFLQAADFLACNNRPALTNAAISSVSQQAPDTPASSTFDGQCTIQTGLKENSRVAKFFEKRKAAEAKARSEIVPQGSHNPATPAYTPPKATAGLQAESPESMRMSKEMEKESDAGLDAKMQSRKIDGQGSGPTPTREAMKKEGCNSSPQESSPPGKPSPPKESSYVPPTFIKTKHGFVHQPTPGNLGPLVKTSRGFVPARS